MRTLLALMAALTMAPALAVLPPADAEQRSRTAAAAARTAWEDKVALYKLCLAMDRTAETYRREAKLEGRDVAAPMPTAPCTDPGPFPAQPTPTTSKPIEAAGAHSPPGTAISPPSTQVPAADVTGRPSPRP